MKSLPLLMLICCFFVNSGIAQENYHVGDTLTVVSIDGLNIRRQPTLNSEIIGVLSYGDKVAVKAASNSDSLIIINALEGRWIEARTEIGDGYLLDAYLSTVPVINLENRGGSIFNELEAFVFANYEIVDTAHYNNGIDGESRHEMWIYYIQGGQYIRHFYWESYEYEIQFENTRTAEGVTFLAALLFKCGLLSEKIKEKLYKTRQYPPTYFRVSSADYDCYVSIRRFGERCIIKISD